ncbi:unnamed protein product [Medioppia subpectinata]|uniref:Uncharacterized protein n=1 Tax=Medioppia subpectinata TaxID=1979941 RepID=A0A7R9KUJ4_9ACAR|nr:unnamed protein product [Medioppia subpectinata]CAG2108749.1 unnamed protein product [Medioppia subpectinata]
MDTNLMIVFCQICIEMTANESCFYRCNSSQDETCVSRDQICDITKDCAHGDDEHQSCDKLPNGSYCGFGANDYCFWQNDDNESSYWAPEADTTEPNEWYLSYFNKKCSLPTLTSISIRRRLPIIA